MDLDAGGVEAWAGAWLDQVALGASTISRRKLTSVERRGGGIEAIREVARRKGVHLLLIKDDTGADLVAASKDPFTVIC